MSRTRIYRLILSLCIAASVAMLPGTFGNAAASQSKQSTEATVEISNAHAKADCDRDEKKPEKPAIGCDLSTACGLKCFGSTGVMPSIPLVHVLAADDLLVPISQAIRSETGSPPFRPPRV
jgi:hypothetical protein